MKLSPLGKVRGPDMIIKYAPANLPQRRQTYHNTTTGRIEKPKCQIPPAERDFRWYDMKMKREATEMAREKQVRLEVEQRKVAGEKKHRQQLRVPSDR
jgi:hypothetical protein